MEQKPRELFIPKVKFPSGVDTFSGRALVEPPVQEQMAFHPSPQNKVELHEGKLSKRYECTGADSGEKSGQFMITQFSADAHFCTLLPDGSGIWKVTSGNALNWFKKDVQRAAHDDATIRAFVMSHPEMGISI